MANMFVPPIHFGLPPQVYGMKGVVSINIWGHFLYHPKLMNNLVFPLTSDSRIHSKERLFQRVEGKWFQVILSLLLCPLRIFGLHYLYVLVYYFESV